MKYFNKWFTRKDIKESTNPFQIQSQQKLEVQFGVSMNALKMALIPIIEDEVEQ